VAFIGAGGKTALMVTLAYELAEAGWRVLATTTVGLDAHQLEVMPIALPVDAGRAAISEALTRTGFVFLHDGIARGRVRAVQPRAFRQLLDEVDSDVLLVEADVSDGKSVKAPKPGEPLIPLDTTLVVPVASMAALGQSLDAQHVYNVEAIIERYGFAEGTRIKAAWLAQILRDETLGLRGVPPGVRVTPFLNQTPMRGYGRGRARVVAKLALKSPRLRSVVIGSVRGAQPVCEVQRPVGAVVLAAGLSTRMGQSKMLLPWSDGRTIIEHIIDQLVKARVDHITVVTGYQAKEIKALLKPLEIDVIYNKNYRTGEMLSSIKLGISELPAHMAAAMIVMGNQPRIQPKVIYQVMTAYAENDCDLVVPSYQMQRGYPILLGRRHWGELLSLPSDGSLAQVMNTHNERIFYVNADNDSVLRDVDTPQDYREERWRAGL
ncbi:MAG: putative selenium-dependent hydroxylase accessory protein YqeC, partial [Armatimonadetes bacterium]|nr:putative selenium-dependent hydroxylase accessory protein YqeC [Anaerolineae bacterium]